MATALEFFSGNSTSRVTSASTTYVDHLEITVDRSAESDTKNFFVFCHITVAVDDVLANFNVRFRHDTTDLGETQGLVAGDIDTERGHGRTFNFVRRVSLTAASHTFDIQFRRTSTTGGGNVFGEQSSIVVLEESANAQYAEALTEVCTDNNNVVFVSLAFDPGTTDDYVFIWAVESQFSRLYLEHISDHWLSCCSTPDRQHLLDLDQP